MQYNLLKSKIHKARITQADLHYEGSLGIDQDLMDACEMRPYERILVVNATKEMAIPVASSTLIMMVIFLPIVFISADVRRMFSDVAFTVVAALLASLVVAIAVVPLLTSKLLPDDMEGPVGGDSRWETKILKGGGGLLHRLPIGKLKMVALWFIAAFVFLSGVAFFQLLFNALH